jgi:2,4-dienoyl-CoA reductase-like NADH-dependent reductase (Old Yellow Enzyme family)
MYDEREHMSYPRIASFKTYAELVTYLKELGLDLKLDEALDASPGAPLARRLKLKNQVVGNRFCILPMEGWDGTTDGRPTEATLHRWRNFGLSGAKLIWGGEAVAVRHDGRANPNQLLINEKNLPDFAKLREELLSVHQAHFDRTDDLYLGLQLTHSGRFARPNKKDKLEPTIVYHHPLLDRKFKIPDDYPIITDVEIRRLVDDFVRAGALAQKAGYSFVDIKHCHGYFGHELLSGFDRRGEFGDSLENRTRFLREIVAGLATEAPGLEVGVRLSVFDFIPFRPGDDQIGVAEEFEDGYRYAFGGDRSGTGIDLGETTRLLTIFESLGIRMVCSTAGSPYYNPHIQRPALFPPSDGYFPPEDPLVGVARQIWATSQLKRAKPEMVIVGSGYSYLQEWLPNVGQYYVRSGEVDAVGLGRMVLSYPEMPADVLAGRPLQRKKICRTFSDCTTAPRNGLISGCYPLDPYYKDKPEAAKLKKIKKQE